MLIFGVSGYQNKASFFAAGKTNAPYFSDTEKDKKMEEPASRSAVNARNISNLKNTLPMIATQPEVGF